MGDGGRVTNSSCYGLWNLSGSLILVSYTGYLNKICPFKKFRYSQCFILFSCHLFEHLYKYIAVCFCCFAVCWCLWYHLTTRFFPRAGCEMYPDIQYFKSICWAAMVTMDLLNQRDPRPRGQPQLPWILFIFINYISYLYIIYKKIWALNLIFQRKNFILQPCKYGTMITLETKLGHFLINQSRRFSWKIDCGQGHSEHSISVKINLALGCFWETSQPRLPNPHCPFENELFKPILYIEVLFRDSFYHQLLTTWLTSTWTSVYNWLVTLDIEIVIPSGLMIYPYLYSIISLHLDLIISSGNVPPLHIFLLY